MPTPYTQRRQRARSAFVGPDRFYRAVGLRRKPLASLIRVFNEMLSL